MANPKYKFFYDECNEDEFPRWSSGEIITYKPSSKRLEECFERIKAELLKRGYKEMLSGGGKNAYFSKPEYCKAAYIGTTVNPYSFKREVWDWKNQYVFSKKMIYIEEVFRHNGTNENSTYRISVGSSNCISAPTWKTERWRQGGVPNQFGVEMPTTYEYVSVPQPSFMFKEIRKLKPEVSDKVLNKTLDIAEEELANLPMVEVSQYEANADDFPEATVKRML